MTFMVRLSVCRRIGGNDPSTLAHSLPLLKKLSHHADIIEQHLVHEIARRATSFFAAFSNLQDLQAESARCVERVKGLRSWAMSASIPHAAGGAAYNARYGSHI
jgi:vacuolar protein sorting-associated protein 54